MNIYNNELEKILISVLLTHDDCIHCKHHQFDKYQCNDCKFIDVCKDHNLYELDINKVKKDYNIK